MFTPILSIRLWLEDTFRVKNERALRQTEEMEEMSRRWADLYEWYQAQRAAIKQQIPIELTDPATFDWDKFSERHDLLDSLAAEHEKRRQDTGLVDHDKKVSSLVGEWVARAKDPDLSLAEGTVKDWELTTFVEPQVRSEDSKVMLQSMHVSNVKEIQSTLPCAPGPGCRIWIDLRGSACPRLTADRNKALVAYRHDFLFATTGSAGLPGR